MKKIYCNNCKWYREDYIWYGVESGGRKMYLCDKLDIELVELVEDNGLVKTLKFNNKAPDCSFYHYRKWWVFWAKK